MAKTLIRMPGVTCPHCHDRAIARSSETLTPLCRHLLYRCQNEACGARFKASLELLYEIVPSATPNPAVRLPLRPQFPALTQQPVPANDQLPTPANDEVTAAFAVI